MQWELHRVSKLTVLFCCVGSHWVTVAYPKLWEKDLQLKEVPLYFVLWAFESQLLEYILLHMSAMYIVHWPLSMNRLSWDQTAASSTGRCVIFSWMCSPQVPLIQRMKHIALIKKCEWAQWCHYSCPRMRTSRLTAESWSLILLGTQQSTWPGCRLRMHGNVSGLGRLVYLQSSTRHAKWGLILNALGHCLAPADMLQNLFHGYSIWWIRYWVLQIIVPNILCYQLWECAWQENCICCVDHRYLIKTKIGCCTIPL